MDVNAAACVYIPQSSLSLLWQSIPAAAVALTHSLEGEVEQGRECLFRVVLQVLRLHKATVVKVTVLQSQWEHRTMRQTTTDTHPHLPMHPGLHDAGEPHFGELVPPHSLESKGREVTHTPCGVMIFMTHLS